MISKWFTTGKWFGVTLVCLAGLVASACSDGDDTAQPPAAESSAPGSPVAEPSPTGADCSPEQVLCVGLVTDVGEIDDRSFNQSIWEGVKLAEAELGAQVDYIETEAAQDYAANIESFAARGYDIIVTAGFAQSDATRAAAAKHPDIDFIGVDQAHAGAGVDGGTGDVTGEDGETANGADEAADTADGTANTADEAANLAGLVFSQRQAGFLAGALAGMLTESGLVAAVAGTALVQPVVEFVEGYSAGARHVNPQVNVIASYHPGALDVAFTDSDWGAATARQAIDQGADVIFGVGGKTGNAALIEVAGSVGESGAGSPDRFCIGVETDQWETLPEARACLVSSATRMIAAGVRELIGDFGDGSLPGGSFAGGDYWGDVGLADYHDFWDTVAGIDDIDAELARIHAGLKDGSIVA